MATTRGDGAAKLVAFALLHRDGEDRRTPPLEIRRAELDAVVSGVDAILFIRTIDAEGVVVYAKPCEMRLFGLASRRPAGVYRSGPVKNWVKIKNPDFRRR